MPYGWPRSRRWSADGTLAWVVAGMSNVSVQYSPLTTIGPVVVHIENEIQWHIAEESTPLILMGFSGTPQGRHTQQL